MPSGGIDKSFRVASDIAIRVGPARIPLHDIRTGKLSGERIVEARPVVQETHLAVKQLIGGAVRGGHGAPGKALSPRGQEKLDGADVPGAVQGDGGTALQIGNEVREGRTDLFGSSPTGNNVIIGRGRTGAGEHGFAQAEIDRAGGTTGSRGSRENEMAFIVVEHVLTGIGSTGRRPTRESPFIVVGDERASRTAARAGVPAGRVRVATGHVPHRVVGRVGIGHGTDPSCRVQMGRIPIGGAARRAAGELIQAIVAGGLQRAAHAAAAGRAHAVIAARWRAHVAGPHQPAERIIAERLVLGGAAPALGGHDGGQTEHVDHVVIRAHLAEQRRAALAHVDARRSLNAVIAQGDAEDRGSPRSLIGSWLCTWYRVRALASDQLPEAHTGADTSRVHPATSDGPPVQYQWEECGGMGICF